MPKLAFLFAGAGSQRSFTERIARACCRRPWVVVGAWGLTFVAAIASAALFIPTSLTTDFFLTNNPESERAAELIEARLAEPLAIDETVVVRSDSLTVDDEAFRQTVSRLTDEIRAVEGVVFVTSYTADSGSERELVSRDRDAALLPVALKGVRTEGEDYIEALIAVVKAVQPKEQFDATITGEASAGLDQEALSQNDLKKGELFFGLPAALIVLALVFGALVAATIPMMLAVLSIVVAVGLTALLGQAYQVSFFVVNMITGMGLALGIDYALFILSRYREERGRGTPKEDAIAAAGATASRAVFFSGFAFVVALSGMVFVPIIILRSLAIGAMLVGAVAVVAALTLLPALLMLMGDKVNRLRIPLVGRSADPATAAREGGFWSTLARIVMRRPGVSLVLSAGVLIMLSIPVLRLDIGTAGISTFPDSYVSKQGFTAVVTEFPEVTTYPAEIVIDGDVASTEVRSGIQRLRAELQTRDIFGPSEVRTDEAKRIAIVSLPIEGETEGAAATAAIRHLRNEQIPRAFAGVDAEVLVGGSTADTVDEFNATQTWLPRIFLYVFLLSFLLLTIAFRSIVVAFKAILLNLLSVGAAYGLLVLVFQEGYGADFLGFQKADAIESWVPLFLFSVLFGLSMDYHVFLLSRIREVFVETGDNALAVERGVSTTARLITGAALIIIVVFTGFAIGDLVMFQQMGFGIAVALLLDATIIRCVLVPASMKLLGDWNWYLPSWLEWLPHIGVEGAREPAPSAPPTAAGGAGS